MKDQITKLKMKSNEIKAFIHNDPIAKMKRKLLIKKDLLKIAQKHSAIECFESRGMDDLDFLDVNCESIKDMLLEAFELGKNYEK